MNAVSFNYDILSATERKTAQSEARAIKGLLEKTGAALIEIGNRLNAVREKLVVQPGWSDG